MSTKYYWLRLMKDFFTQPKIKKLRKIAGGDTYTVIYLKLQLLSLDNDGVLIYQGIEQSFAEEMALTIDEDIDNVNVTINFALSQGLMKEIEPNQYLMVETQTLIGSETSVALRVRKHRENQKALHCNTLVTNCNTLVTNCNIEKEKEIEIEKEYKEKDKKETFVSILDGYTDNKQLKSSLKDFIEMRNKMKGYTTKALKLNLSALDKLTNDDSEKIAIVNQSIARSWKSFYQLKESKLDVMPVYESKNNVEVSNEDIEKYMPSMNRS